MKAQTPVAALFFAASVPAVVGWGNLGHETIAYIATNFVSDDTASFFQNILGDSSTDYLANVATYADSYRYTSAGAYSKPYHFIDANDNPPSACNVDYDRDCDAEGCVVLAIKNYTQRVQDGRLSAANKAMAAKMIVHFLGDIHQPLHDEALDVGGNTIDVTYAGQSNNLHAIWDTAMPEQYAGGYSLADANSWASQLTQEIQSGTYQSQASGWLNGMELSDPVSSAMVWASDANAYVCSVVMPNGVAATEKGDLSGTYYNNALPTIQLQFAKAGYRLAGWLNLIATGEIGL